MHPFEKHLSGLKSPYELLQNGSWVSGNAAAENGFDLRLFYQVGQLPHHSGSYETQNTIQTDHSGRLIDIFSSLIFNALAFRNPSLVRSMAH